MRQASQDFSALLGSAGPMGHAGTPPLGFGLCAALAYPLGTEAGYGGAVLAAFVSCIAVLFLAYTLGAGALAFSAEARSLCLPGSQRLKRRAILIASLLLVVIAVIPGAALARSPLWEAWLPTALVLSIALAGVLIRLLSTGTVGLLLVVVLTGYWAVRGEADRVRDMELFFALLSAALALAPVAKWRRVVREGPRAPSPLGLLRSLLGLLQPWWARSGHRPSATVRAASRSETSDGFRDRSSSVTVIRMCLGGYFARRRVRKTILAVVFLVVLMAATGSLPPGGGSKWHWTIALVALLAATLMWSGFLQNLSKLTRGDIAELALLPGLGEGVAQRRALCWAVLAPPIPWLVGVLVVGSAGLLLKRVPLSNVWALGVYLLIVWLTYAALALVKLGSFPPRRSNQMFPAINELLPLYLGIYLCAVYEAVYTAYSFTHVGFWFWVFWAVPALAGIALVTAIGVAVHRLASVPHPFLWRA